MPRFPSHSSTAGPSPVGWYSNPHTVLLTRVQPIGLGIKNAPAFYVQLAVTGVSTPSQEVA